MLGIAAVAILALSFGTYSYPATSINSLSPTPLAFVNPLPTVITLRMFAYRGPCSTKPLTVNSFRITDCVLRITTVVCKIRRVFACFCSAGMAGSLSLTSRADTVNSQCTGKYIESLH